VLQRELAWLTACLKLPLAMLSHLLLAKVSHLRFASEEVEPDKNNSTKTESLRRLLKRVEVVFVAS
jgi:hypothetical protein